MGCSSSKAVAIELTLSKEDPASEKPTPSDSEAANPSGLHDPKPSPLPPQPNPLGPETIPRVQRNVFGFTPNPSFAFSVSWSASRTPLIPPLMGRKVSVSGKAAEERSNDLPLDVLVLVAGGQDGLKGMRGVNRGWKAGFDSSVTHIKVVSEWNRPLQFPRGFFAERFPWLTSLDLGRGLMGNGGLDSLSGLTGLTSLTLGGLTQLLLKQMGVQLLPLTWRLTDSGLDRIHGFQLRSLDLSGCHKISNLDALLGMPLTTLNLDGCSNLYVRPFRRVFTTYRRPVGADLGPLRTMPLTALSLRAVQLSDESLSSLRGLPLTHLILDSCAGLSSLSLAALRGMPLQSLDLSSCGSLTSEGLNQLRGLPLTSLGLRNSPWLRFWEFTPLLEMPLVSLSFSECALFTDQWLARISGLALTRLDLACCHMLTNFGLANLRQMPLTHLDLACCNLVTDAGLILLRQKPLTYLDLGGCSHITSHGLGYLRDTPLRILNVDRCRGVTVEGLEALNRPLALNMGCGFKFIGIGRPGPELLITGRFGPNAPALTY